MVATFQLAGTSNQCQGQVIAKSNITSVDMDHADTCSRKIEAVKDIIK